MIEDPNKNTPDWQKPVEYNLSDQMAETDRWDAGSPFLGLADVVKPTTDPEQEKRTKGAAKAQAFGDVLSSLFDTAVSSTGGIVEKDSESKNQLRNLEQYNKDKADAEMEGRRFQAAQLQDRINNARNSIEEARIVKAAKLRGYETKAEKDWLSQEAARKDNADLAKYEMIYGKKALTNTENNQTKKEIAAGNNAAKVNASTETNQTKKDVAEITSQGKQNSSGANKINTFQDRDNVKYELDNAGVNAVYDYIIQHKAEFAAVPGFNLIDVTNSFDPKLPAVVKTNVVNRLYQENPNVFAKFKEIVATNKSGNAASSNKVAPVVSSKPEAADLDVITSTLKGKITNIDDVNGSIRQIFSQYPNLTNEQLSEVYDRLKAINK